MATYYGNTDGTSNSSFRIACEYTSSNLGNGYYQYRYRFYIQVTKGNFYGTSVDVSWSGSNVTIRGSGKYGYSGYSTKNVAYGSAFTLGSTAFAQYTASSTYRSSISGSTTISTAPKPTYTVKYNANGGSGAPSSQTKTYGTTLKLSSTKPKRTGYTFQGWGTSATDTSVNYAAGANYTSNANITLYAIWKANTYTVKYNANGGSGAPGNQTKTYGKTLTLSSTKPTRTNYIFKGWGTSASSTTVSYAAGASYTSNASITLYAIWELAYVNPRINNLSIDRCTSSGVYKDDGTYARVKFGWQCDQSATSCYIEWNSTQNGSLQRQTVTVSGTSSNVDVVVGNNLLDVELTWSFKVYLADSSGNTTEKFTLSSMHYEIDFLGGGGGVAIGMAAVREGFDVDMEAYFRKGIFVSNGSVSTKVLDMASDGTPEVKWGIDGLGGNIMNPIWSGTWSSGSISVPMILYYKIILVRTNYANGLCIPMYRGLENTNDFCGIGGFPYLSNSGINAFWLYGIYFTVDNSANLTLEKAHRFSIYADGSNPANNTSISITEIYGVL